MYTGFGYTSVHCGAVKMGASRQENFHDSICIFR